MTELERKYSLFMPTDKGDLMLDYPELRSVPSFKPLQSKPKDMLFVWYYACKASPGIDLHGVDRITFAVKAAFGERVAKDLLTRYQNKQWSSEVDAAIADMRRYEPSVRIQNKIHATRLLRNLNFISSIDFELDPPVGWDDKRKAIAAIKEAAELIPVIQKLVEGDLGVVDITDVQEPPGAALARAVASQLEEV